MSGEAIQSLKDEKDYQKSAKLRITRALVPYVLSRLAYFVPDVLSPFMCLMLDVFSCFTCLKPDEFLCITCHITYVPRALHALVSHVFSCFTCSCASCVFRSRVPHVTCALRVLALLVLLLALRALALLIPYLFQVLQA